MTTPSKEKSASKNVKFSITPKSRRTLSELSLNDSEMTGTSKANPTSNPFGQVGSEVTLRYTPEIRTHLKESKQSIKDFISNKLGESTSHLEIVGWSKGYAIKNGFYNNLFTSDLKAKKLTLRGRGEWSTCCCPKAENNKFNELIDTTTPERTTSLEEIYIFRSFRISSCALLDLISRSPNLKVVRFYGVLLEDTHHDPFLSVRFLCSLEAVYWPWCNVKTHKPTLRTLVKRNDTIQTLYTTSDIACDFINSDLLPNLKYLSIIMNEKWTCSPGKTKILKRYNRNIEALRRADKIEALEIRTFDVNQQLSLDSEGDSETHDLIRNNFETYKLHFWENVRDLANLKYLAIYGAWELEEVTREMSKHGLQIEYFKTNLTPNSILSNLEETVDNTGKFLVLQMSDAAKHLAKLAKLKSLHFTCHENLSNIDEHTTSAMRELSGLIWKFEIKSVFTTEVEELFTNILRRGNHNGSTFQIRILIQPEDQSYANIYGETKVKITTGSKTLKEMLTEFAQTMIKERFGKSAFKTFSVWGLEQVGDGRDKVSFNQLQATWSFYEHIYHPLDQFI